MAEKESLKRGSTPEQIFNIPIDLRSAEVYVTYQQDGENLIERTNDTIDISDTQIRFTLTQEETLALGKGKVKIQIKYKLPNGHVDYSEELKLSVEEVLKGEVI